MCFYYKIVKGSSKMIVYGVEVLSDTPFPLHLPQEGIVSRTCYLYQLHTKLPFSKDSLGKKIFLHTAHGREIFFYHKSKQMATPTHNELLCYEVENVLRFYWHFGSSTLYYEKGKHYTPTLLAFWFIHMFFPLYLTLESHYQMLHANALEVKGHLFMLSAPYQGGKSTLASYFIEKGHHLISDDVLPTNIHNQHLVCHSAFPYHHTFRQAESLGSYTQNFKATSAPIEVIYFLKKNPSTCEKISIVPTKGIEKFKLLKENSLLYSFQLNRQKEDAFLFELLKHVQVFTLSRPWGTQHLDAVYHAIIAHQKTLF